MVQQLPNTKPTDAKQETASDPKPTGATLANTTDSVEDSESNDTEFNDTEFDDTIDELDISHLKIEDDKPVDNFQSAQQQRLLVDTLWSNDTLPRPFIAEANVGLFYQIKGDPVVPDMLLSLGVQKAEDYSEKRNRAYFVWELGKVPEVCIEVVSNREGDEVAISAKSKRKGKTSSRKDRYARIGVPYYVVFDPLQRIQDEANMNGALLRVWSLVSGRYVELTSEVGITAAGQSIQLETVGLGLTVWEGPYEEQIPQLWLRWCDTQGNLLLTGAEGKAIEKQRADAAQQKADAAQQKADAEQQKAERLAEKLRQMGVDPDEI
ncbi:MAG: Uma2 family endonuclease [Cyanobacteria bacterium J06621_11]